MGITLLPVHIGAGMLALVFGYIALFAKKGAVVHRQYGMYFVYAMAAMSLSGALMSAVKTASISVNVVAGLITFYFVSTGLLAVRRRVNDSRQLDIMALAFAIVLAILAFQTGLAAVRNGRLEGAPMFIFGIVAVLAAIGDARLIRARGVQPSKRLSRHLWRMCFAMWVAAASFFWGPRGRVPEIIYYPALLPIPVLLPIAVMVYWLWRIRVRKTLHGIVSIRTLQVSEAMK